MLPVLSPKPSYKLTREHRRPWARRHAGNCHSLMHVVEIALDRGAHIAPLGCRHINFHGIYRFTLERYFSRLRPSRYTCYTSRHG